MNTKTLVKKLNKLLPLSLLTALLSACVAIPNTEVCSAAGKLAHGAICAEELTGKTRDLTFDEFLDMIEPRPGRPGGIFQSSADYAKKHAVLEEACRELGSRCSYEVQQQIKSSAEILDKLSGKP